MSDIAQKIISQANLARMSSLPELLLCELNTLQGGILPLHKDSKKDMELENLLAGDVFLYLRLLASSPLNDRRKFSSPAHIIQRLGHDNLISTVRQAAAQMSFDRPSATRLRFLKQIYLQSLLSRTLSEQLARYVLPESPDKAFLVKQAGFCGLFLNIGALIFEQVFSGKYLEMVTKVGDTQELLKEERKAYGIDHAQLGAELFKSWGVEGLCCDALHFHHMDISQVLDATPLVKIAWLANQLADEKENVEAPLWADALFELQESSLMQIREAAQASVKVSSQVLNIAYSTTRYIPLPVNEDEEVLRQEKIALTQLRKKSEADNLFALARESLANAERPEELGKAIGSAIRLLFGPGESLLFVPTEDGKSLHCITGTSAESERKHFVIRCEAERSVIADCFLDNEAIFNIEDEALTVIDRQILSLLGTDNFCCEPLSSAADGKVCGVLVLGIAQVKAEQYKNQTYLRNDLCQELGKILSSKQEVLVTEDSVVADYERRIRETIHEANNPLGIIKNYLQLLSIKQGDDTKIQSEISFMKSEIDRVSGILEKLKDKPEEAEFSSAVNINSVVTSLVSMFSGSFAASESINIETELDSDLPVINCRENAIRQIITNLVKNSAEAFEDGGTLLVKTAGNFYMNGNRYIQLTVKDNGPGIAPDILDQLFSPGNSASGTNKSTKGGNHTGSGLSIVQSLVEELGGQVSCQTSRKENAGTRHHGTEITVLLPLSANTNESSLNSHGTNPFSGEPRQ